MEETKEEDPPPNRPTGEENLPKASFLYTSAKRVLTMNARWEIPGNSLNL